MKFTVYSKANCPYCEKITRVFEHLSKLQALHYVKYDLGADYTKEGFYSLFGEGSTFPQVVLNDTQHLGGCSETITYLEERLEPHPIFDNDQRKTVNAVTDEEIT